MNLTYDRQSLIQGNRIRRQNEEQPATFAEYNGATDVIPAGNMELRNQTRMAGQMGARALELMNNPEASQQVNNWMELFGQSNQGAEFNMAKSQQAMAQAQLAESQIEMARMS